MAINPGISLEVKPFEAPDPTEGVRNALTMRDMLQRQDLNRQQLAMGQESIRRVKLEADEKQRQVDSDKALQQAIQTHSKVDEDGTFKIDHDAVEAAITHAGYPDKALTYNKSRKEIEDNSYNMIVHNLDINSKKADQMGKLAQSVLNAAPELQPSLYSAAIKQAVDRQLVTPDQLQKYNLTPQWDPKTTPAVLQQVSDAASQNPFKDMLDRMKEKREAAKANAELPGIRADSADKQAKLAETQQKQESQLLGGASDQSTWDNALAQVDEKRRALYPAQYSDKARQAAYWAGVSPDTRAQIEDTKTEADLAQKAATGDINAQKALKVLERFQGNIAAAKETARVAAEMGILGNTAGTTPQGQAAVKSSGGRNEELLAKAPAVADTIRGLADYKIPLPGGMALRSPYWQQILNLTEKYDPSFDASQYTVRMATRKDFTSGRAAQNVRALNTVTRHLDELDKATEGLNNFGGDTIISNGANAVINSVAKQKVQARYNEAANAVSNELVNAFRGSQGGEADIKSWRSQFSNNASKDVQKEGVKEAVKLMAGRIETLYDQYEKAMGKPADFNILDEGARKTLRRLGLNPDEIDPPKQQAKPPAPAPKAQSKVITPDLMTKARAANKGVSDADIIAALKAKGYEEAK